MTAPATLLSSDTEPLNWEPQPSGAYRARHRGRILYLRPLAHAWELVQISPTRLGHNDGLERRLYPDLATAQSSIPAPAHTTGMQDIARKKDTGEPGNGGQFGRTPRSGSGLSLVHADPEGIDTTVHTHRLGSTAETDAEVEWSMESGEVINDQTARTIASWYQSPGYGSELSALASGATFNTSRLLDAVNREIDEPNYQGAMIAWVEQLEAQLADD